jgi:hypothetical protein
VTIADVPPAAVTRISTVPDAWAGATAVTVVDDTSVKVAAGVPPNVTPVTKLKLVPVMVTAVPPPVLPEVGLTAVTVGVDGAVYVKWSEEEVVEVPLGVVTVMSTVAAASAGEVAVMVESETTVKETANVLPKSTAVAPVNPLPVTVTTVPPDVLPLLGLTAVTLGAEAAV